MLFFLALSASRLSDINSQQNYNNAQASVSALADAADSVYAQGEGASKIVTVTLPGNTNFTSSYIGKPQSAGNIISNEIDINVAGTDTIAIANAPLSGSFPAVPGTYQMKVLSQGSGVTISPYLIDSDLGSVSVSMGQGQSRTATLNVYRTAGEDVNVSIFTSWDFPSDVNLSIFPNSSFNATPEGTAVSLTFNSSGTASGFYSSQMILTASGTASGTNETIPIPVTVDVQ